MIQQFMSSMEGGPAGGIPISSPAINQTSQQPSTKSSMSNNQQSTISKNTNEDNAIKPAESTNSSIQE